MSGSRSVANADWWSRLVEAEFASPTARRPGQEINQDDVGGHCAIDEPPEITGNVAATQELNSSDGASQIQLRLESAVCLPLQSPLLRSAPRLRRARTPVSVASLRRSGRLAARSRAANATVQAQRVLLKKLGVEVSDNDPDMDVDSKLVQAFRGGMSDLKKEALQNILGRRVRPFGLEPEPGGPWRPGAVSASSLAEANSLLQ